MQHNAKQVKTSATNLVQLWNKPEMEIHGEAIWGVSQ